MPSVWYAECNKKSNKRAMYMHGTIMNNTDTTKGIFNHLSPSMNNHSDLGASSIKSLLKDRES